MTKPGTTLVRLVLLDADVVIRLFELGVWDKLVTATRITLAEQVFDQAAHYFDPDTMARMRIDLDRYLDKGLIDVLGCDATEAAAVLARCCRFADLHAGELESLTILCRPGMDALFCTADRGAIRAAVMLDLTERIVSLEELLRRVGLSRSFEDRALWQFSERGFQQALKRAAIDRVQNLGES